MVGADPHGAAERFAEIDERGELLALTAEIVAAHAGNNAVAGAEVVGLIQSVFDTLCRLAADEPAAAAELTPAVPIRRSVTDDHIVCLEDGKKLKMVKRHLMTDHGMTPEEYRSKWGLKQDYPMVAPTYSAKRQTLAKQIGLGTILYASDYDEKLPDGKWNEQIAPYTKNPANFVCSQLEKRQGSGFAMNGRVRGKSIAEDKAPAELAGIFESNDLTFGAVGWDLQPLDPKRHEKFVNTAFLDGHAKAVRNETLDQIRLTFDPKTKK